MKKIKMIGRIIMFLALLCALSGWAQSASLQDDIQISLKETRIRDFSREGLSLVFFVSLSNSSSTTYFLSWYEYRFVVNQEQFFQLQIPLENKIRIEPRGEKLLSFPVKITYAHLFRLVEGIETENQVEGLWSGTMAFADNRKERGRLPFSFSGVFPIFQDPEIEFQSLRVRELTIGGADVHFEANVRNPNVFFLRVERISYQCYLRNSLISEEAVTRRETVGSEGEKSFTFPMLMNFFDVGKEVYAQLQRSSTLCRFTGEIEAFTEWGRVKIPFDKTGRIPISRTP